ncbi:MAG: GGDEF domain-containing response regulator [Woeseiaceae bacterium]|nr:GGDEF domain-containing response regulator [Woeseiaceae bacterium]
MASEPKRVSKDADGLTVALRQLSVQDVTVDDAFEEPGGTALLISRDNDAKKWCVRWLGRSGLQVTVASDPANGLAAARSHRPDVIVVDAATTDGGNRPMFEVLQEAADVEADLIVLCSSNSQVKAALEAGVFDIARKPFNWQSVAARAFHALQIRNRNAGLTEANDALKEALELANVAHKQLRSNERFEPVTGLPNKSKFVDLVGRGMRAADRDGCKLAVFAVGFSRFRLVVEAMGQEQANNVLAEIGNRMATCVGESEAPFDAPQRGLRTAAIGMLDSFRFGLMLTVYDDESLSIFQQRLLETLARPIQLMGQMVNLSACLGIAVYPQDAEEVDQLLQRADNAMRDAQSRGGGFRYYCAETDRAAARRLRIEHLLHEALDREELTLAYQPILDVASNEVVALEALLRWQQADGSYIGPEEFVTIAEESGLMLRTGEYVLSRACQRTAAWRAAGIELSHVCVNVAKVQLMSPDFVVAVQRILAENQLDPGSLELEISERGVLSGDYQIIAHLQELKNLGVRLSIDDFGTGDSAIAYLKELPVDALKIDRSYIAGFGGDGKHTAIASAMVALGQRLDLTVVAEGVESVEQLDLLRELGCDCYQGFLAAKPMAHDAVPDFLATHRQAGRVDSI